MKFKRQLYRKIIKKTVYFHVRAKNVYKKVFFYGVKPAELSYRCNFDIMRIRKKPLQEKNSYVFKLHFFSNG